MIDLVQSWWQSYQLQNALKQNHQRQAQKILGKLEQSKINLPIVAQLFRKQIDLEKSLQFHRQEISELSQRLKQSSNLLEHQPFIHFIQDNFCLVEKDKSVIQCQGIEHKVFESLELSLAEFIQEEFEKIIKLSPTKFKNEINLARHDINGLKNGIDPSYNCSLSSHIYLLQYFLENVYCNYLAWFLIYKSGLLTQKTNILDIAAGPGTVIYGLALLLQSYQQFIALPPLHISYYSLEQQSSLQYKGLQFWRKYIESPQNAINAYFRFDTVNLFDKSSYLEKLPKQFFNFIFISHCFFYETHARQEAHRIYQQIFKQNLSADGSIVLIIQGRKLFGLYNTDINEDIDKEQKVIQEFLDELGLNLEWYRFISSTGKRIPLKENFGKFANEYLPKQFQLSSIKKKYLKENWVSHYTIDDYIILAKPKSFSH